ncbi:MAG: primase C-terminal domain-containing protein, partial [Desulfobaccales bacterium]
MMHYGVNKMLTDETDFGKGKELPQDSPFPPLPAWVLEYIEREISPEVPITQGDLLPETDWVAQTLQGVNRGERNNAAAKLAGYYLARGEPEPRVLELIRSWNLRNPEPLADKEIQTTVASIAKKEAHKRIRTEAAEGKSEPDAAAATNLSSEEQRQAEIQGLGERLGIPLIDIRVTKAEESIFEFALKEADSVMVTARELA